MHWGSSCESIQCSNRIVSDATDNAINHLWQFQKNLVLEYESNNTSLNSGHNTATSGFSNMGRSSRKIWCALASERSRISVRLKLVSHTLSYMRMIDGHFLRRCNFSLSLLFFSITAYFLCSLGDCAISGSAQGFPWLWECSTQEGMLPAPPATSCSKSSICETYWFKPYWWVPTNNLGVSVSTASDFCGM